MPPEATVVSPSHATLHPGGELQPGCDAALAKPSLAKPHLASLRALRREFASRGFFVPDTRRVLLELACHSLLASVGLALFVVADGALLKAAATPIWAYGLLGISTNTHTSSHYATARRRWVNELLVLIGYCVVMGFPATYWWHKHLVVHHPNPNIVGVDDDIDLMPFFALTDRERSAARGVSRLYYSIQVFLFPFAIALNGFNIQRQGLLFLARVLRDPKRRRPIHWLDAGLWALHFGLWVFLPMLFVAPATAVAFYLYRNVVIGYALFVAFAPAHFPSEAACADESETGADFALKQTAATVNFRTGRLGRLVCSGVEYQIEHHLFFAASHTYYPEMSRLVEEFCRHHGYPYRTLGWLESLVGTVRVFAVPKRVERSLERPSGLGSGSRTEPR